MLYAKKYYINHTFAKNDITMDEELLHSRFSRTLMAGLFVGLIAAVASLVYNSVFREMTEFSPSQLVNVSTIIFTVPILLLCACFVYYGLANFKFGKALYLLFMLFVIMISLDFDFHFHRSADQLVSVQFRNLLLGIIAISGVASFFIPYMATHKNSII
jgi:hypothetical protein